MSIGILVNCSKSIRQRSIYIFETLFSIWGVPYHMLTEDEEIGLETCPLVIHYGTLTLPENLECYLERGGFAINITSCEGMDASEGGLGKEIHGSFPPGVSSYLTKGGSREEIPFFYPFMLLDSSQGQSIFRYKGIPHGAAVLLSKCKQGYITTVGIDLIASAFYLLSRQEEIESEQRDRFGRFPAEWSIAHKEGFLQRPVVNEYLDLLIDLVSIGHKLRGLPLLQKWYWPSGKKFAACLTHDVDAIGKWPSPRTLYHLYRSVKALVSGRVGHLGKELSSAFGYLIRGEDPYSDFERLIELEKRYRYHSSFYFRADAWSRWSSILMFLWSLTIAGNGLDSPRYDIRSRQVKGIIERIAEGGSEVSLHAGHQTYLSERRLSRERELLEKALGNQVKGVRQHFLRLRVPTTLTIQERVGLKYDTTLGYADDCGFRAGMSFPFYPYDALGERQLAILEIPLIVMDHTLFRYKGYSMNEAWRVTQQLINEVKQRHGVITLLWHSNLLDTPGYKDVYEKSLAYLSELDAYVVPCSELVDWWLKRDSLKFINAEVALSGGRWTLYTEDGLKDACLRIEIPNNQSHGYRLGVDGVERYVVRETRSHVWIEFRNIPACSRLTLTLQHE